MSYWSAASTSGFASALPVPLLGFFDDSPPNQDAIALAPTVGWLMLAGAVALVMMCIANRDRWRRFWLAAEDPRAIGLYRIVFGIFVLANINGLWEHFRFLFTDEGIFTADVARAVHASSQFVGFGDGFTEDEPWGFFDFHGFLEFLKGPKYSLLYFWDTPQAFWLHIGAFELCGALFIIGFWTRTMGVLLFFLMNSILFRNHLPWEGSDLVFRVFLAYLICAKAGHAYSVDNWLRCRKLRKQGLLSERDGPGGGAGLPPSDEHPKGLQPIYRLIPAWPRRLAIFQLGAVYTVTGLLKNGSVWAKGDAIYYAWSMDHFYRFYPQKITALLGTNVLRISTWVTHWGEGLFFLAVLGVLVRFAQEEKFPRLSGWRAVVTQLGWLTLIAVSSAIIWVTWPVHFTPPMPAWLFVAIWAGALLLLWGLWWWIGRRPLHVPGWVGVGIAWILLMALPALALFYLYPPHLHHQMSVRIGLAVGWLALAVLLPFVLKAVRKRPLVPASILSKRYTIDRAWVGRWPLGRRVWITFHFALMGGIFIVMNIGQFQTGMLSQAIVFFTGLEIATFLRMTGRRLAKLGVPGIPDDVRRGEPPIPAANPDLPQHHRDAAAIPEWALFVTAIAVLAGVIVRAVVQPTWEWRFIWLGAAIFLATIAALSWYGHRRVKLPVRDADGHPIPPWGYGPLGRLLIGSLIAWQLTAVTVWLLPDKDSLHWRGEARRVFTKWLTVTQTDQGWGMFAPNPPRSNVFLRVLVTDQNGDVYDMKTDVYAPERKPIPWIWNDRIRKMNRRIIGGESGNTQWYRKWYARYHCREWALNHGGEAPKKVELVKVSYRIPSPEETAQKGYYVPEELYERTKTERVEHTEHCERTIMGQLPNHVRERYDLPPLPESTPYRPWLKHKKSAWERRRAKALEAQKKEAEADEDRAEQQD